MNKEFEQTFAQRRYTNDNKHMKRFGTSLILKEIKFKTKRRYHSIPARSSIIKKKNVGGSVGEDIEGSVGSKLWRPWAVTSLSLSEMGRFWIFVVGETHSGF